MTGVAVHLPALVASLVGAQQGAGMIRQRSTSSAPAGNTAGATPAPVPSRKSGGLGRPFAGVVLAAPVQHALLETLPTSLSYEHDINIPILCILYVCACL